MIDEEDEIPNEDLPDEVIEVVEEFNPNGKYTSKELEEFTDALLQEDKNRELCRKCIEKDPESTPYGEETGQIESVPQYDEESGEPLLDDEGNQLYIDYPELKCKKGHRWYKGEGPERGIKGLNPILFESHLYNRRRRELYAKAGTVDPAYTMDRFGRQTHGIYNRAHPEGRKINTKDQRSKHGASYYR